MARYIITVQDTTQENVTDENAVGQEIFRLGVEEFDALTLCAALNKKPRKPRRITTAPTGK